MYMYMAIIVHSNYSTHSVDSPLWFCILHNVIVTLYDIYLHNNDYILFLLQKLHNVQVALSEMKKQVHLPAGVTADSVIDGHREKTLALLWTIIFHFKVW